MKREYWCFISYRHTDNVVPGRQWATWLHQALETYEIPDELVGQKNNRGEEIPERIFPVFRDEDELPADADLSTPIVHALENSRILVVLCSPSATKSRWVADEILKFKMLGKQDRILAAIIDGIPNAIDDPDKEKAKNECFPKPLRHHLNVEKTKLSKERTEPVASDFRLPGAVQGWTTAGAYRESLELEGLTSREIAKKMEIFIPRQHLMLLKIIAGVLGVPLGVLSDRDKAFQLAKQQQKARVLRRWLIGLSVLVMATVVSLGVAVYMQSEAERQRQVAEQQRIYAISQEQEAKKQEEVAIKRRKEAEEEKSRANRSELKALLAKENEEKQRLKADENAAFAVKQRKLAEERLERARLQQASMLLGQANPESARLLLRAIAPKDRGWEWVLLAAWCGPSSIHIDKVPQNPLINSQVEVIQKEAKRLEDIWADTQKFKFPSIPKILARTSPFDLLSGGWLSSDANILGAVTPPTGRQGMQALVLRTNPPGLSDVYLTALYGGVSACIPSPDGSMTFFKGDDLGGQGDYAVSWSNRKVLSNHLISVPDIIGIPEDVADEMFRKAEPEWGHGEIHDDNGKLDLFNAFRPEQPGYAQSPKDLAVDSLSPGIIFTSPRSFSNVTPFVDRPVYSVASREGRISGVKGYKNRDGGDSLFESRTAGDPSVMEFLEGFRKAQKPTYLRLGPSWQKNQEIHCLLWISKTRSPLAYDWVISLECWNVTTGKIIWKRPHPNFISLTPDAAVHLPSETAVVYSLMEIVSLADGSKQQKLELPWKDYRPDDAAWWSSRCIYSPDGNYAVYFGQGRNGQEFMLWRVRDGKLITVSTPDSENAQPLNLPDSIERRRLGNGFPRVLSWEASGAYVAIQPNGGSLRIYQSLEGEEIKELPQLTLHQNWYDVAPVPFSLNRDLNRVLLGSYILDPATWEVLLELPQGTRILQNWNLIAFPTSDGRVEFVHPPVIGADGKAANQPRSLQEALLFYEYGL